MDSTTTIKGLHVLGATASLHVLMQGAGAVWLSERGCAPDVGSTRVPSHARSFRRCLQRAKCTRLEGNMVNVWQNSLSSATSLNQANSDFMPHRLKTIAAPFCIYIFYVFFNILFEYM